MKNQFNKLCRQAIQIILNYDDLATTQQKALMEPQRLMRKAKY
jgi:hypothetical protein